MATSRPRLVSRSSIDLSHPAHADLRGNFIRAEASAGGQRHCRGFYAITVE